jgi:hypothetical protein
MQSRVGLNLQQSVPLPARAFTSPRKVKKTTYREHQLQKVSYGNLRKIFAAKSLLRFRRLVKVETASPNCCNVKCQNVLERAEGLLKLPLTR